MGDKYVLKIKYVRATDLSSMEENVNAESKKLVTLGRNVVTITPPRLEESDGLYIAQIMYKEYINEEY